MAPVARLTGLVITLLVSTACAGIGNDPSCKRVGFLKTCDFDAARFLASAAAKQCFVPTPANKGYRFIPDQETGVHYTSCTMAGGCGCRRLKKCRTYKNKSPRCSRMVLCADRSGRKRCTKLVPCEAKQLKSQTSVSPLLEDAVPAVAVHAVPTSTFAQVVHPHISPLPATSGPSCADGIPVGPVERTSCEVLCPWIAKESGEGLRRGPLPHLLWRVHRRSCRQLQRHIEWRKEGEIPLRVAELGSMFLCFRFRRLRHSYRRCCLAQLTGCVWPGLVLCRLLAVWQKAAFQCCKTQQQRPHHRSCLQRPALERSRLPSLTQPSNHSQPQPRPRLQPQPWHALRTPLCAPDRPVAPLSETTTARGKGALSTVCRRGTRKGGK